MKLLKNRLKNLLEKAKVEPSVKKILVEHQEIDDDLLDEILEDEEDSFSVSTEVQEKDSEEEHIDIGLLKDEIREIEKYINWAHSIGVDTKSKALIKALNIGFDKMAKMGAARKAVIFTESRRTQDWLFNHLTNNGYDGEVITFNGTNTGDTTARIYIDWLESNKNTGRITGSRQIDIRAAVLDYFKNSAGIMIATEAGAEGLNMQFCSLVINFDLPWNPQRIEQRIGRCHRYGQKFACCGHQFS